MNVILTIALVIVALAIGMLVYGNVAFFRKWFIPPAIIAGTLLLISGPFVLQIWTPPMRAFLEKWPPVLLGFLFAGVALGFDPSKREPALVRPIILQNVFVYFLCFGQLAVGFLIHLLFFRNSVSPLIGHVIEIGWAGGP